MSERIWTGLNPAQTDGLACVICGCDYLSRPISHAPVGRWGTGSQVFACVGACAEEATAPVAVAIPQEAVTAATAAFIEVLDQAGDPHRSNPDFLAAVAASVRAAAPAVVAAVPATGLGLVVVTAAVGGLAAAVTGQPTGCPGLVLTPVLALAGGRVTFAGDWQLTDVGTGLRVGWSEPDPSWLLEMATHHVRSDRSCGYVGPATGTGGAA